MVSTVETEYGPCACSPMGKVKRVSRPYGPGGSAQYWTTYTYDSLGRTVSVQQPPATVGGSSAGTTAYLYEGNTVKVTDPAGKWKKFTMNAVGELVEVREPNPADVNNDFFTTYTYTVKGQLWTVTMPRPTGTQTRTFTYHASGAVATVTQPETGVTTNTVGTDVTANDYGMLKTKVDAEGQKVEYIYDAYKRVIEVKRYKVQSDTNPDACQGTKYQYDVNTWDVGFGAANLSGRPAGVEYHVCTYNGDGSLEKDRTIREMYSYSVGGRPLKKRMQLQRTDPLGGSGNGAPITGIANLDAEYTWSQEGTLLTLKYPDLRTGHPNQQLAEKGNTIAYQTDWLRRYSGMTEATALNPGSPVTLVSNMQYGISGELTSMTYNQPTQSSNPVVTETRQYNLLGQLTQITAVQGANTVTNLQYVFPTGTNNGRISSMVNIQSGETVTYTYDALNRLTNAVGSGWSEAYAFDGFGNLTQKGAQSIGVLAASNRLTGPGVAYDSNGNQTGMQVGTTNVTNTFDVENRLLEVSGQGFRYGFGPDNRKMWTRNASNGNEDYVFWGPQGKPIGTYRAAWEWTASSGTLWFNAVVSTRRWMGGKEISATSVLIHDRLSSVVGVSAGGAVSRYRYLPYGEPNTAGGSPVGSHFASYDRTDAAMYYADQRYYRDGVGRFLTADPYKASGGPSDPASWNRYAYVGGDPTNSNDPAGLVRCWVESMKWEQGVGTAHVMCSSNDGLALDGQSYSITADPRNKDQVEKEMGRVLALGARDFKDFDPENDWDLVPAAASMAIDILNRSRECSELFGNARTRAGRWNPTTVIRRMFLERGTEYGRVDFENAGTGVAETRPAGLILPSASLNLISSSRANISFHRNWWNRADTEFNARTILHEVAHLFNLSRGSGGFARPNTAERGDAFVFDRRLDSKCK